MSDIELKFIKGELYPIHTKYFTKKIGNFYVYLTEDHPESYSGCLVMYLGVDKEMGGVHKFICKKEYLFLFAGDSFSYFEEQAEDLLNDRD